MNNLIKQKRTTKTLVSQVGLLLIVFMYAVPLYIAIVNAFKPYSEIITNPLALPANPTFDNFITTWKNIDAIQLYLNSMLITGGSLLLLVLVTSMAAYVVARSKHKSIVFLQMFFLLGFMVPVQMILIPSIKTMQFFNLFHTMAGMILFNCAVYFSTSFFLYSEFFKTLPKELEESAFMDGANKFTIYYKILLPVLKPCTSTVIIFSGMWIWNDFLPPLYLLDPRRGNTITTGVYRAIGQYSTAWDTVFAAVILSALPILILYLCLQRQFQSGLAAGAVKG